ncbi:MAG TPA: phospholipase D-like domain-containing protein [Bacteroidales bacterium]|nr:phospholipase D-like domain-containing protein [Bacteroidales bacterium]
MFCKTITLLFLLLGSIFSKAQSIKAFFNHPVNLTASSFTDGVYSPNLEDTIVSLINKANETIDIAVWDNGSTKIVNALNNALLRGCVVRYITSSNSLNTALSALNSNIPVLTRQASLNTNVMHNKFIVLDSKTVFTGSMNFGSGSMFDDFNNVIIIQDSILAANYILEFNEMWGSTGSQPNSTLSKFGPNKTDNTQHQFVVSTIPVQLYFSPSDGTTSKIVDAINTADFTIDIAMFTFINNDLGDAVVAAKQRGVQVRAIIENVNYIGSEYQKLLNNGIQVLSHASLPYDFHHKYCIIDAFYQNSDPIVVTGSHNWTNSAEEDNDENTVIIHDFILANQFTEEFTQRYNDILGVASNSIMNEDIKIFPNPFCQIINITLPEPLNNVSIRLKTIEGKTVFEASRKTIQNETLKVDHLPNSIYLLEIFSNEHIFNIKMVKNR